MYIVRCDICGKKLSMYDQFFNLNFDDEVDEDEVDEDEVDEDEETLCERQICIKCCSKIKGAFEDMANNSLSIMQTRIKISDLEKRNADLEKENANLEKRNADLIKEVEGVNKLLESEVAENFTLRDKLNPRPADRLKKDLPHSEQNEYIKTLEKIDNAIGKEIARAYGCEDASYK